MPESSGSAGGKPSTTAGEARKNHDDTRSALGFEISTPREESAKAQKQQRGQGGSEVGAVAVAVKVCVWHPPPS